ncbi:MAG: hypothetical protein M1826_005698 [Phylliscum demangeonii]|nr:MAG: hypothetical protein M1826_005698 [Phylliscum demangeonii]
MTEPNTEIIFSDNPNPMIPELGLRLQFRPGDVIFLRSALFTHYVLPFEGERASMVYFTHENMSRDPEEGIEFCAMLETRAEITNPPSPGSAWGKNPRPDVTRPTGNTTCLMGWTEHGDRLFEEAYLAHKTWYDEAMRKYSTDMEEWRVKRREWEIEVFERLDQSQVSRPLETDPIVYSDVRG